MSRQSDLVELTRKKAQALSPGSKNMLYNGDMSIAQRGTSYQFSNTNASNYGTADRWQGRSSQGTTITQSVQSDAPAGFAKSLRYYCDSGGTITQMIRHQQQLEGRDWQHLAYGTAGAKDVTLSFWVKSNVTGTYTVSLYVYDANEIYRVPYTIDSSGTWEYKTITFAGNTTGNCNNDGSAGIELAWALGAASGYQGAGTDETWETYTSTRYATGITADIGATTGNYWQITGCQLEVGPTATDFEHIPYGVQFRKCQRFYQRTHNTHYASGSFGGQVMDYPVFMRATPTVTNTGLAAGLTSTIANNAGANGASLYYFYHNASGYCTAVLDHDAEL